MENEDIFWAKEGQIFDHYECYECGQIFLGFDSYCEHSIEKHDHEVITSASIEELAAVDRCVRLGGCVYEPAKDLFPGTRTYRCKRCGWLMIKPEDF